MGQSNPNHAQTPAPDRFCSEGDRGSAALASVYQRKGFITALVTKRSVSFYVTDDHTSPIQYSSGVFIYLYPEFL